MKRAQDLAGFTVLCTLALTALLGGCSHNDAAAVASAGTDTPVSVSPDGLPEVIITASRPTVKPIVLSAKVSSVTAK